MGQIIYKLGNYPQKNEYSFQDHKAKENLKSYACFLRHGKDKQRIILYRIKLGITSQSMFEKNCQTF